MSMKLAINVRHTMIKSLLVLVAALHLTDCVESDDIINLNTHFSKIDTDEQLQEYVHEILERLNTFKVPVHPRIRLFYQLLHKSVSQYADRTADSIFVPYKYRREDEDDDDSIKIEA